MPWDLWKATLDISSIVSVYLSNNSRVPPGLVSRDLKTRGWKLIAESIVYGV